MHIWARFDNEEPIFDTGKMVLTEIEPRLTSQTRLEVRALYSGFSKIRLVRTKMSFTIDDEGPEGVSDLKASIQGQSILLGCYVVFAAGGGSDGLVRLARQFAKWAA